MAAETIGDRRKQRGAEQGATHRRDFLSRSSDSDQGRPGRATHLYTASPIPDRLSGLPVGRHRPEFIRSQGGTPRYILLNQPPIPNEIPRQASPITQDRLPPIRPIRSLPQRFPTYQPEPVQPDPEPVATIVSTQEEPPPRRMPALKVRPAAPGLESATHAAVPELEIIPVSEPALEPTRIAPRTTRSRGRTRGRATVPLPSELPLSSEPTSSSTELRSATETRVHGRRRRVPRKLVAAATAILLAGGLAGGLALWKRTSHHPPPDQKPIELVLPEVPQPLEPKTKPPIAISITETGVISTQEGNQWNAAADKTRAAGHSSNSDINVVAKVGAYDSRETSPDPDAADAGDAFTTLTEPAIDVVDRLQQPPGPAASQAEIDAAQIIYLLNHLGPMETQALIAEYGDKIEALKNDIITILSAQAEKVSYQEQDASSHTTTATLNTGKNSDETKLKQTTVFSQAALSAVSLSQRSISARTKKATAFLAADRLRRQR